MSKAPKQLKRSSSTIQILLTFVVPLVILLRFSKQSQLGATNAMLLALAFPVAYELYNVVVSHKKPSMLSLLSIGGILVTGLISLLGLSEGWLAVRRSVPYLFGSLVILISIWIKHPLLQAALSRILDMERIRDAAKHAKKTTELIKIVDRAAYMLSALLLATTAASYVLTRVIITAPTQSEAFNQEYAKLRLLSLPAISLPLLIGTVAIVMYLLTKLEKLTGLDGESLVKKRN